ncbi:hypothetical protein DFR52_102738 [Hoeflea marina]|uniref:Uncharacterized protein n=1 Tax=Hoeflea marina TaxID=274592 RepID=A0A317PP81_9HYPH|nr:hypothetical protein DFR52_102738 [Hoeflea marina]
MYVPPWTILAGLGSLDRCDLCNLLASVEETTLLGISADKATDLLAHFKTRRPDTEATAFALRMKNAADKMVSSGVPDRTLRIRLWFRIMAALELDPVLPLSKRTANAHCAAVAYKAAAISGTKPVDETSDGNPPTRIQHLWSNIKSIRGGQAVEFASLVVDQAELVSRAVAEAAETDVLSDEERIALGGRVLHYIEERTPELRDEAMRAALKSGDRAALALLLTGGTALGIGLGVNLAGFSAYILAAQASAFIPMAGGPAVVATLFMLANPWFSIPMLAGGVYFANRHVTGGQGARLASLVAVQLALRGLSADQGGLRVALSDFRSATHADFSALPDDFRDETLRKIRATGKETGGTLPDAPGAYRADPSQGDRMSHLLDGILSRRTKDELEVAAVAAITAGDMLYTAVSIDPAVLNAADFSRSADIGDIFQFGAFADGIGAMGSTAAAGAGNNLRGYVAEQIVAARLVETGHVVTFPDTANNPGFDLLVDGHPFQVKCLLDINGLRAHFGEYPDMPVYANSELAEKVIGSGEIWAAKVFYIDGYDREIADFVMTTSLEAGEALGDFNIPYIAMAVSSARNLHRWWRGRIPLSDLPAAVVLDGSIKGGLAAAGGLAGKLLGLLVFGPAGALVLGGAGGVGALLGAGWTRDQATRLVSSGWHGDLELATDRFRVALIEAIRNKVDLLADKRAQTLATERPDCRWLAERFSDDIVSLCETMHELRVDVLTLRQPSKARACLEIMTKASVHPMPVEAELTGLLEMLKAEPSVIGAAGRRANKAWSALRSKSRPQI